MSPSLPARRLPLAGPWRAAAGHEVPRSLPARTDRSTVKGGGGSRTGAAAAGRSRAAGAHRTPNRSRFFLPTPRCPRGAARACLGRPLRPGPAKRLALTGHGRRRGAAGRRARRVPWPHTVTSYDSVPVQCPGAARRGCFERTQGLLGHFVDLNISGRRAYQERLPGVLSTRKGLSLCLLAIAHSWSGAPRPNAAPRAANGCKLQCVREPNQPPWHLPLRHPRPAWCARRSPSSCRAFARCSRFSCPRSE